jgi:ubiquinone/menaquinone biosynthesis C-methylase UbiE
VSIIAEMSLVLDPQRNEKRTTLEFTGELAGKRVLEIGCGDGRKTWYFANQAGYTVGIDPKSDMIETAKENTPPELRGKVEFHAITLEDFANDQLNTRQPLLFDLAIFSWSL